MTRGKWKLSLQPVLTALEGLASRRPVFWSEADLQHELAWELRTLFANLNLRLERVFRYPDGLLHVDLVAERRGTRWGIELKYRKGPLDVVTGGERFVLADQGAEDSARYDFLRDVARLERLRRDGHITEGIAILVTNSSRFWRPARRPQVNDADFRLDEGRTVAGSLRWADDTAEGAIRSREAQIELVGSYDLSWSEYSSLGPGPAQTFRYLAVPVVE